MNTALWILVTILSVTLFIFLVVGIVLLVKLVAFTKEARKVVVQGQGIAEKADDIVDNVRDMTTVGGLVKHFVNAYTETEVEKNAKPAKAKKKGTKYHEHNKREQEKHAYQEDRSRSYRSYNGRSCICTADGQQ